MDTSLQKKRTILIVLAVLCTLVWGARMIMKSGSMTEGPDILNGADFQLYYSSFQKVQQGGIPGINFFVEYPPLAPIGWLSLALVAKAHTPAEFLQCLYFQNTAIALVLLVVSFAILIRKNSDFASNIVTIVSMFLGLLVTRYLIVARFDIFPATLLTLALLSYQYSERAKMGFTQLLVYLLASAVKIYPLLLAPVLFDKNDIKTNSKNLFASIGIVVAVHLPFLIIGSQYLLEFLRYHGNRNIEIESSWAFLGVMLNLGGTKSAYSFGSYNFDDGLYHLFAKASMPIVFLLSLGVWILVKRRVEDIKLNLGLISIALVSIFVLFGKVWSPQYMIWFIALLPLLRCRLWAQVAISGSILVATVCSIKVVAAGFPESIVQKDSHTMLFFFLKILCVAVCAVVCVVEMTRKTNGKALTASLSAA